MKYFEVEPATPGRRCERSGCACGSAPVAAAESYLFVPSDCVNFRIDCPTLKQAQAKVRRMMNEAKARAGRKFMIIFDDTIPAPRLYCRQAAETHGIDLKLAAADAAHWRSTSQAPYRPTPIAGHEAEDMSAHVRAATGCAILVAIVPLAGLAISFAAKLVT